jgi:hypothetical protein
MWLSFLRCLETSDLIIEIQLHLIHLDIEATLQEMIDYHGFRFGNAIGTVQLYSLWLRSRAWFTDNHNIYRLQEKVSPHPVLPHQLTDDGCKVERRQEMPPSRL